MQKALLLVTVGVLAGVVVTQAVAPARAQVSDLQLGGYYSHDLTSFYEMQVHITPAGKLRAPRKFEEQRPHYRVPEFYGTLIGITNHGSRVVFWYQDSEGLVRNAVFDRVAEDLIEIERADVNRLRFEIARP